MPSVSNKLYFGKIDLSIENNSHTQVFLMLQEHCNEYGIKSANVLEIGCNTGYFSQLLKDHGHFVCGVEPCTDEALHNGCVDRFFGGTIEAFISDDCRKLWPEFDAIIMGDVLEHTVAPEYIIRHLATFLKPKGILLISVPNITHISIRHMLEDGQWLYKKYGLLDETHKCFFSRHSLRKLLIKNGFGIEKSFHVLVPPIEEYAQSILHDASNVGKLNKQEHTFQIVVRASMSALSREAFTDALPKNILVLSPGIVSPCSMLRLIRPLSHYCRVVGGSLQAPKGDAWESLRWADVIVVHRECTLEMLMVIKKARSMGISVIYDIDDLLYELPPWLSCPSSPLMNQIIRHVIATADKVTCTTKPLLAELETITDKACIVPNVIFEKHNIDLQATHNATEPCTLIIASSDTVQVGFVCDALQSFIQNNPRHKIIAIGEITKPLKKFGLEHTSYAQCSPEDFSRLLLSIHNGVGIIPLDDSKFSSCKSAIKYYHYTMCGVVSIASNVLPYSLEIENGKSGLLVANTFDDWLQAIERISADASLRRQVLARAVHYCQRNAAPSKSLTAWEQVFHGLPRPDKFL